MEFALKIVLLAIGFFFLIKGAGLMVESAVFFARRFSVSEMVIALTVVSFGTSAPELIINMVASWQQKSDIVVGNIIGSDIANILLVLGFAGLIRSFSFSRENFLFDMPFVIVSVILAGLFLNDFFISSASVTFLSRADGFILLSCFALFMWYIYRMATIPFDVSEETKEHHFSTGKAFLMLIFGLFGLFAGGKMVVSSAVYIARFFHVSDKLIALTIVSIGSSLPELITSAVAAYKGKQSIALGNVLGSNIFNIFLVLGSSALVSPVRMNPQFNADILFLTAVCFLLFGLCFFDKKRKITRGKSGALFVLYIGYTIYLIFRG